MRRYLREVWRTALRPGDPASLDDGREPLSYRAALIGLVLGAAGLVAFAMALGLALWIALFFFLLYLLVVISYTRIRAEAGLPWAFGPDMTPHQMITAALGTQSVGTQSLVALTQFQWMDLDYRTTVMPPQLEAMKIATEARLNQRHLCIALLTAAVVGALSAWVAILAIYYRHGAATADVDTWRTSMGSTPWHILSGWVSSPIEPDPPRLIGVGVGVTVTGLLMLARAHFMGWPFHPVGYALAGTFTMPWLWSATLIGWLIKLLLLRYGGMKAYRLAFPFFVGLILGDYLSGSLWALLGLALGEPAYRVVPI